MAPRNRYRKLCADCGTLVEENQGFLFGSNNIVVHEECVYSGYGVARGYFSAGPRPVRSVPLLPEGDQQ